MPVTVPMPTKNAGDVFTSALWNSYLRDNINKLLNTGHRVLTVAQFAALTGLEGTKGTVAPDEVYLEVDSTNGIQWHFAYESGEPTYKWRFLGGPPMNAAMSGSLTTASSAFVSLTSGPSIVVPRLGDYDSTVMASAQNNAASANNVSIVLNRSTSGQSPVGTGQFAATSGLMQQILACGVGNLLVTGETCTVFVKSSSSVSTIFTNGYIEIIPRRIG